MDGDCGIVIGLFDALAFIGSITVFVILLLMRTRDECLDPPR